MTEDTAFSHKPVLLAESMHWLNPRPGLVWVDATMGFAGHLSEILKHSGEDSTVIGIDQDAQALEIARQKLKQQNLLETRKNLHLVKANFSEIENILAELNIDAISGGIIADIGVSSMQLDNAERGFSFNTDGPLDMRMDLSNPTTAATLVNTLSEKELADILYIYGEEKRSRHIAKKIVAARPLNTTQELASLVTSVIGRPPGPRGAIHPATRTFQALRIAVNDELSVLEKFIHASIRKLAPGGRIVLISFHSLEDRLVKQIFKEYSLDCICPPKHPICNCSKQKELKILTNKPLQPKEEETLANPRSRSAKLRAGERLIREL